MVPQSEVRLRWHFWRCTACGERTDPIIERNRKSFHDFMQRSSPKLDAELLLRQLINAG